MSEITLYLDQDSKRRLYEQIYDYMVTEIRAGRLLYGERLPSTRSLAESLGISRSTVDFAYGQLQAEGYIEARPYRGYFVCKVEDLLDIEANETEKIKPAPVQENEREFQIDFSPNAIDMTLFPFATWRKITRNTLNDDRLELFSPGLPQGDLALRQTIARYLHAARGVDCDAEQIIIGAGNDYLLMLLTYILGEGRTMGMENPTYQRAYRIFESLGYTMKSLSMDKQGLSVRALESSGADTAYVMPSHQYPTGATMPIGRRSELLSWAAGAEDRYLIEDDYDSEFRYRGKPIPSLQSIDRNGRVIYIGTFSKAIAPAIRISYMVLPEALIERYRKRLSFLSSTVSRIDQATLNEFIRDGFFERYLNRMRKHYRLKHDAMLKELRSFAPDFKISGGNAGMHLLLTSKKGLTAEEMVRRAAAMDLKVYSLTDMVRKEAVKVVGVPWREKDSETELIKYSGISNYSGIYGKDWLTNTILLGFGGLSVEQIKAGVKMLRICFR